MPYKIILDCHIKTCFLHGAYILKYFPKILHTLTNIEVIVIAVTVAADGLKACS